MLRRPVGCARMRVALGMLLVLGFDPSAAPAQEAPRPFRERPGARPSAALEYLLREWIELGRPLPAEAIRRFRLDEPVEPLFAPEPGDATRRGSLFRPQDAAADLLTDAQANDTAGDASCSACSFRPLVQSETTIASLNDDMIAGWNDSKGFCGGAVQGYGYSSDGGATWTDAGEVPALATGGRYRGDPVHAVNRKTGDFYICGLYEGGAMGSGLALLRGTFLASVFTVDDNRQIAVGSGNFLDKEWVEVDSLSGNIYVTYSNFVGGSVSQIELIRSTDNGLTWDAPIVLNDPLSNGNVQGSRPMVGPDGELYVAWTEFELPENFLRIRRSDDFGVSFGPVETVAAFVGNDLSGAPGYRRNFTLPLPGIAVDRSDGPHRGRVHVTWSECVNYFDAPFSTVSPISEVENNGNFANATPFAVGDVLRGTASFSGDLDVYRFDGLQGQTVVVSVDSAATDLSLAMRLVCSADTTNFNTLRSLAFTFSNFPSFLFTLPADGSYYLHITSQSTMTGPYRVVTAVDVPTLGDRAGDHRDVFASYSDDGAAWSAPVKLNDDDPWHDQIFPEIAVDGVGCVHAFWHDWRDDAACAAESHEYMVSSGDGGVTWGANRRASDAISFWSTFACGSANQGDYQGITAEGRTVHLCWADSRNGDPDVFVDRPRFESAVDPCGEAVSDSGGANLVVNFSIENTGNTETPYDWAVVESNGWLTGVLPAASGSASLAPAATQAISATLALPPDCSPSPSDTVRIVVSDPFIPGRADTCETLVTCETAVGVPGAGQFVLALLPPVPNPATNEVSLGFTLPAAGPARLAIYSAAGALVRVVFEGDGAAGPQRRLWDGRDQAGRPVAAGTYFVRFAAAGETRSRTVTLLP